MKSMILPPFQVTKVYFWGGNGNAAWQKPHPNFSFSLSKLEFLALQTGVWNYPN